MARLLYAVGTMVRETGQALDRLGCSMQGSYAFREQLSRHRAVMNLFDKKPSLPPDCFVAPSAGLVGDVTVGPKSSVWYGALLRGDVNKIVIGRETNVQDGSVIHVSKNNLGGQVLPTIIGDRVTIGHSATLHACTVESEALVGMGATVLDGAKVSSGAIVAAGAVVTPKTVVPPGELWGGNPAKFMRAVTPEEKAFITESAANYVSLAAAHKEEADKPLEQIAKDIVDAADRAGRSEDYNSHVGIAQAK